MINRNKIYILINHKYLIEIEQLDTDHFQQTKYYISLFPIENLVDFRIVEKHSNLLLEVKKDEIKGVQTNSKLYFRAFEKDATNSPWDLNPKFYGFDPCEDQSFKELIGHQFLGSFSDVSVI